MLTFKFTAIDPTTGNKVKSTVQADDELGAAKVIKNQGLAPLDIKLDSGSGLEIIGKFTNRIRSKDKIIFSRQLSTLINAGLPLAQSLRNVSDQTTNKAFRVVVSEVIADVEAGVQFSAALEKHPKVFNNVYISLVAAGEVSGTLDAALLRLAAQQEKDAEILSKIRGAMAYPAIVVAVMVLVIGFMFVKVLPQVQTIYADLPGASLPLITRLLLSVSNFVVQYWYVVIIVLVAIGFCFSRYARSGPGKQVVDRVKMRAWPFGPLFMKVYMARFGRTATTLVASGVPLIQMLEVVGQSINNVHVARSIDTAIGKVKGGKSLADSLEGDPNFLPLVPNMLRIGEESGALEDMLDRTADYYEKEVDNQIKTISTVIEPLLMVILGVVAFVIVAAVLLPVYGLVGQEVVR